MMEKFINVSGDITDITKAYQRAWKILERDFPGKFCHDCVSHGLHLLVKDKFAAAKTKKGGSNTATYPVGYPFEIMLQFAKDCMEVVNFFHNHNDI